MAKAHDSANTKLIAPPCEARMTSNMSSLPHSLAIHTKATTRHRKAPGFGNLIPALAAVFRALPLVPHPIVDSLLQCSGLSGLRQLDEALIHAAAPPSPRGRRP